MVLKRFSQALLAALPLVLLLAACGTDSEPTAEPVSKPPATSEPVPTPKPTATSVPEPKEPSMKQYNSPPAMTIDPNKSYTATLELEKGGEIVIELFAKEAPVTVNNFIFLARDGYYDQVTFHRVIADFMAQSGDPTGTGSGGPGYTIPDEFSPCGATTGQGCCPWRTSDGRTQEAGSGSSRSCPRHTWTTRTRCSVR